MEHRIRSINALVMMAILAITGCANFSSDQDPLKPTIDPNAVALIERVKAEPSRVSGGGMIYELFVGGHFNAKLDQQEGTLTLADIETNTLCQYGTDGLLKQPPNISSGHTEFCTQLSANTAAMLDL